MFDDLLPSEDVEASRADQSLQRSHPLAEARRAFGDKLARLEDAARRAGIPSEALEWVYFRSPRWTWEHLCGRAGWLLVDRRTQDQVGFIDTIIS